MDPGSGSHVGDWQGWKESQKWIHALHRQKFLWLIWDHNRSNTRSGCLAGGGILTCNCEQIEMMDNMKLK